MGKYDKITKTLRNAEIVKLRDGSNLSFEEIGRVFNISRQKAHFIYHREKAK